MLVGGALFIGWGVTGVTVHSVAIFVVLVLGVGGLMGWDRGDCEKMLLASVFWGEGLGGLVVL